MKLFLRVLKQRKWEIIISFVLIILYGISRLINLTLLPIFTDEAIYLRWAQIALHDPSFRFISLTDGKQPSFVWLAMLMMRYVSDPLLAGRIVSVLAGLCSMVGIGVLGAYSFGKIKLGFWAAFLYLISPFFLFYDKLALYDSLTATCTIWGLFLLILLVRTVRLDVALILGMVLGAGLLTKSSAFLIVGLLPVSLLLFDWKHRNWLSLGKWLGLSLISTFISLLMYNALRLSPWFYIINRKNAEFVYPVKEWLLHPLQFFLPNLNGLTEWLLGYLTIPLAVMILLSLILGKKYLREKLFFFLSFLLPFIYLGLFGKVLFPRYLLFMTVPLYVLGGLFLYEITRLLQKKAILKGLIYCLFFFYPVYFDLKIIFDIVNAPIPENDRHQFIDDWPSGYGLKEVVSTLKQYADKQPIFLATEGTFGLFPAAFELYFYGDNRITIRGYWPMNVDIIRGDLQTQARLMPTYLVFKDTQKIPQEWPIKLIQQIRRGRGSTYLRLYEVLPN